jgi:hypothetical protein
MVRAMQIVPANAYSALSGIRAAQARLDADADRIAQEPFDVDALVESGWQALAVAANAQVLRAADESTGALFDALA